MLAWSMLFVQAALAVAALWLLRARVLPAAGEPGHRELILDVWGPIAVIAPMLFGAGRIEEAVGAAAWITLGGPVACGLAAVGAAMVAGQSASVRLTPRTITVWTAAGLVLLLLGSAHELTIWTGQCAFAVAAILLWINMPAIGAASEEQPPSAHPRAAGALLWVLLCALGQGALGVQAPPETISISGAVTMVYAGLAIALAARVAGAGACLRIGGWAAAYGVLFGLGVISTVHLLPETARAFDGSEGLVDVHVAYGFGRFAPEAMVLVGLAGLATGARWLPRQVERAAGVAVILAAAALAAWRLG